MSGYLDSSLLHLKDLGFALPSQGLSEAQGGPHVYTERCLIVRLPLGTEEGVLCQLSCLPPAEGSFQLEWGGELSEKGEQREQVDVTSDGNGEVGES